MATGYAYKLERKEIKNSFQKSLQDGNSGTYINPSIREAQINIHSS